MPNRRCASHQWWSVQSVSGSGSLSMVTTCVSRVRGQINTPINAE